MARKSTAEGMSSAAARRVIDRLLRFRIEVPSWGYADTGTRFGKFLQDAAAVDLEDKLADAGVTNRYTGITPTVAVHVLWDFPDGFDPAVVRLARKHGVKIGSINPNLFQDQCYKYGSLTNRDPQVRKRALGHVLDSIAILAPARSKYLSLWMADGTNYPGQADIRQRKAWATEALKTAHAALPRGKVMLIEYKPFEPGAYFTDFFDWGAGYVFAKAAGPQAKVLVDTGHHLQGCNIEQIVAWLIDEKMLGGFHFNDRKYADDDLTVGSIDPYQAFRIFNEIVAYEWETGRDLDIAYMIDQSHAIKPKVQAMIQTACTVQELLAKALCVDRKALARAQGREDTVASEEVLRTAFKADVAPLLAAVRKKLGVPADPLAAFRSSGYEQQAAKDRRAKRKALGLTGGSSYA
ncbi:MAG TPA: TIM barrel protein [Phycisphaerae bacterium]|nr:TIM barrel protein [Phycisphaerae bacterium]